MDDLEKLKQKVDQARRELNTAFTNKIRQGFNVTGIKGPIEIVDSIDAAAVALRSGSTIAEMATLADKELQQHCLSSYQNNQRPLASAYLVIICDPTTNAILHSAIWSSPEWEQSRLLDEPTYIALEVRDKSFDAAADNLIRSALTHLFYHAKRLSEDHEPGAIIADYVNTLATHPSPLRYARLLEYFEPYNCARIYYAVHKMCGDDTKLTEIFRTLIVSLLPKLRSLFPESTPIGSSDKTTDRAT